MQDIQTPNQFEWHQWAGSMFTFTVKQFPAVVQAKIIWKSVEEGQIIFREGEPAEVLFWLDTGEIQLLQYTQTGKAVEHYRVLSGEFFAEVVLFLEHYACSAVAVQPCRIAAIPKALLVPVLIHNSDFSLSMMEQMSRHLHFTKILLELRSYRSARERVLRYLQIMIPLLGQPNTNVLRFDRPLKEIANSLGMTPEAFSRTLKQLQKEGLLTRSGRKVFLHTH